MSTGVRALEGVKIVEFGGYAAGPHVGKMLANFGATVVDVESTSRPDGIRMQYPPYKDGQPGRNSRGCLGVRFAALGTGRGLRADRRERWFADAPLWALHRLHRIHIGGGGGARG